MTPKPAPVPAQLVRLSQLTDCYLVPKHGCTFVRGTTQAFFLNERELGRLVAAAQPVKETQ